MADLTDVVAVIGGVVGISGGLVVAFWRGAAMTAVITKAITDSAADLRKEIQSSEARLREENQRVHDGLSARIGGLETKMASLEARVSDVAADVAYTRGRLDRESVSSRAYASAPRDLTH